MSENSITITPPIRSIAAEGTTRFDPKSIEDKIRERSTSSTSSSSSSRSTVSINHDSDDEDDDDDDDGNPEHYYHSPLTISKLKSNPRKS